MSVAVIFDFDGVLVDTGEYHHLAWIELAKRENLDYSKEFFKKTFGMQNYQIIPQMTDRHLSDEDIEKMSEWKEAKFRDLIAGGIKTINGVEKLLKDLADSGFKLAVGSSAPRVNLEYLLGKSGLNDKFEIKVAGEDARNGKPAPDTFLKAAELLGIDPSSCIVIEDAVMGVQAGKAAGMKVIAITTTKSREELFEADLIIDNFSELKIDDFNKLLLSSRI